MTELVGILNLTPDSFSDDGLRPDEALEKIDAMIKDGASVIDIGAESTRPGATTLQPEEEWARLAPVAERLGQWKGRARFSVDTRNAQVAGRALEAGFDWINDVSGGADPLMFALAKKIGCHLVVMHSLNVPASKEHMLPGNADAVAIVLAWAEKILAKAGREGLDKARLILDPGIGFGKSAVQSVALLKNVERLKELGSPVLIGHSRKSFLSLFTDKPPAARDPETLAVSCYLAAQGVNYLRVHDIKSHAAMLHIREAL